MSLRLSILDQSPVHDSDSREGGNDGADALRHTIELARKAEQWGYHRFWVAEHHGSGGVMGSSPEVLVSHLLAHTSRIRVGSGGVMLQHYSPYKVAENFNVLASLAPGRVDLGIGRGPGGLPRSTAALRRGDGEPAMNLAEKLDELRRFLHDQFEPEHPLYGLHASPLPPQPPDLFLLGTTRSSGDMAAELAMPYVFALFLNNDEGEMAEAVRRYQAGFDHRNGVKPRTMLALPIIVADADEEAAEHAAKIQVVRITLDSGRTLTVGSVEAGEEFGKQSGEGYQITVRQAGVVHGGPESVRRQLHEVRQKYRADEIIAVTAIDSFEKRLRSFELLGGLIGKIV
ncbi:MAG: LLM class flavin-dependent oxidoreductase [Chloroflexi bacterium]|nr:LLM class flavin-dependent oxidoreductase [Chloroflexota bacterium]